MPRKTSDPAIPVTHAELWRVFNTQEPYLCGESLFECAFLGGPALALVNLALELRENDRSYKNLDWVREHWEQRTKMKSIRERVSATYFMYVAMFQLARPLDAHQPKSCERPGLEDTSRGQCQPLMGMGLLGVRGESLMVRAARAGDKVQCAIQSGVASIWIDNYHRHQYATTPKGQQRPQLHKHCRCPPPGRPWTHCGPMDWVAYPC